MLGEPMMTEPDPTTPPQPIQPASGDEEVTFRSENLLQGQREIKILHEGETYRLLVTRNGKLILQK